MTGNSQKSLNGYYQSTGNSEKTLKSLCSVNLETRTVGSGDGAWLLSVPRSSIHRLRGQEPAVLALGAGGGGGGGGGGGVGGGGGGGEGVWTSLSFLFSPPGDGSIKTEILPQRTSKPKELINTPLSASASTWAFLFNLFM